MPKPKKKKKKTFLLRLHFPPLRDTPSRSFYLSEKEHVMAIRWARRHKCRLRGKDQGAIGGVTTYTFTPTGVGILKSVKCACGESLFLTDAKEL